MGIPSRILCTGGHDRIDSILGVRILRIIGNQNKFDRLGSSTKSNCPEVTREYKHYLDVTTISSIESTEKIYPGTHIRNIHK